MSTDENKRYRRYRIHSKSDELRFGDASDSDVAKYSKEFRRLPAESRTVIGPNGESIYIPKHMRVENIYELLHKEYGLSIAEISGIFTVLKQVCNNPEFCGKINRVVASGMKEPLRIVRPEEILKDDLEIHSDSKDELEQGRKLEIRTPQVERIFETEEDYRIRQSRINEARAERYREAARQRRIEEQERNARSKNLERQIAAYETAEKTRDRRDNRIALKVVAVAAALYFTGLFGVLAHSAQRVMRPDESLTPITITDTDNNGIITNNSAIAESLRTTTQPTPYVTPQSTQVPNDGFQYQSFEVKKPTITNVSEGLNKKSRLYNTLQQHSKNAQNPIIIGGISSYEQFEELLQSEDVALLYTSGPAYFEHFSRQLVQNMIRDKYNADNVAPTYEKKGKNNEIYEFYIRYYRGKEKTPFSMEGRVDMTRNEEGRLETDDYHTFPMEVYETLALIGEFSNYKNSSGTFDLQKYAMEVTNGDVEAAKKDLKEKMEFGTECLRTIIQDRVRSDKKTYYTTR